jgi:hypothetical protein
MAGTIIRPGNPSNIQPPQEMPTRGTYPGVTGPQRIPQAPFPQPRIPISLPWDKGSTGIRP